MFSCRTPTSDEINIVRYSFHQLNEAFPAWTWYHKDPYDLLRFAYYEGCSNPIMSKVAPYAVGMSLVSKHFFQWVMIQVDRSWHYGVIDPIFKDPIDLAGLKNGQYYRLEAGEESPTQGELILLSLEMIILHTKWRQLKGSDAHIPDGNLSEIREAVFSASIGLEA